eukprot:g22678.t1
MPCSRAKAKKATCCVPMRRRSPAAWAATATQPAARRAVRSSLACTSFSPWRVPQPSLETRQTSAAAARAREWLVAKPVNPVSASVAGRGGGPTCGRRRRDTRDLYRPPRSNWSGLWWDARTV